MRLQRFIYLFIGILTSTPCSAEEGIFSLSLEQLLKVKTQIASNVEDDWRKQPASVSIITRDKITLSNARTLSELLTLYVPGYFMVEDQDDTIAGFRGLVPDNNSKVLLLLNGVNLNTEWFWGPPDAILNGLDLDYIERIEVTRGPGSVTLGQGALLGVINVVTRQLKPKQATLSINTGADGLSRQSLTAELPIANTLTDLYIGHGEYTGNPMPDKGWANLRADQGLSVFERMHHLHRSEYNNFLVDMHFMNWRLSGFHFEQKRDLYNFYRDREVVEQSLDGINVSYQKTFSENLKLSLAGKYLRDDYALFSRGGNVATSNRFAYENTQSGFAAFVADFPELADDQVAAGLTMGGTRENRAGLSAKLNWDNPDWNNRLAMGIEVNYFQMGKKNSSGNNFIINEQIQQSGLFDDGNGGFLASGDPNLTNAYVKPARFNMKSVFLEDYYALSQNFDLFAAFRWDSHPNWGEEITPRLGLLYDIENTHLFRLTLQSGFRGAVGVQFAGGFVQDGFLAEENFDAVNAVADTQVDFDFDGIGNNDSGHLSPLKPESIQSLELAYEFNNKNLRLQSTLFLNRVEDILIAKAHGYDGLSFGDLIGSDAVGTWNGSWYYQNQNGAIEQLGFEFELNYQWDNWYVATSHSFVSVLSADSGTIGSYVLENKQVAAYPENVTRLHLRYNYANFVGQWNIALNDLWFQKFYSPAGTSLAGANIADLATTVQFTHLPQLSMGIHLKNLFDTDALYPIVGTGDLAGAAGSPAIEKRSWWLEFAYQF